LSWLDEAKAVLQRQRARTELIGPWIFHNPRTRAPWNAMCLMAGANPRGSRQLGHKSTKMLYEAYSR
jgi:hypothetical protein